MNSAQKALINKDVKEVLGNKQIFLPMLIVPIVLMVVVPTAFLIAANFMKNSPDVYHGLGLLMKKLPPEYLQLDNAQFFVSIMLNVLLPAFFLLLPVMASGIIGASSFVGEREHKTMETLLYTPISMEELMQAKVLGVFIPSMTVVVISFVMLCIVMNIGGMVYFGRFIFPNLKWVLLLVWLVPALTVLSLTFTVLVSAKSTTFQEAQQVSGFLVLPIMLLVIGQFTGLFLLNNTIILLLGIVIFIADYFLIKKIARGFIPEKLV